MAVSGADIVAAARNEIGDPYVWGAEGPNAFDCSGLVQYVYGKFGIRTPRVTYDQVRFGTEVAKKNLQPGDLIFSSWDGKPDSHVGIYSGNGTIINAPQPGENVKEQKLSDTYWAHVTSLRRYPGVTGGPATGSDLNDAARSMADKATKALAGVGSATDILGGINDVGLALASIGEALASVGEVAEFIVKMFLPSTMIRVACGFAGTIFLLIGIWFLSREVRNS